ncbi:MAG: DNA mismatch repair endonuclease MutL [Bacteroidota bacterium]
MTDIIKLLPDHVANQIAAGEVVQRPASVVKELLENAIDAEADTVSLIVKDGGKSLIQVVDNGIGMSTTDARLSFERHATSKIKKAEDLFDLHTKGFRGEALASIAAIAHVEMQTRTDYEETGTHLRIEGGQVVSQEVCAAAKGTSLSVKNLFFNIPARRNFLKSHQVELRHIIDEFHRVALAHPDVAFRFYHNGGDLFNLPKSSLRQRIVNIFGTRTHSRLVPVKEETQLVNVQGFIIKPEFAKKSRGEQFFFVNHRFVKSPYLHHAVVAAFEGLLKSDTYPGYFLYLDVDPASLDINIHPTKTEVKFEDEHSLYAILRSAIKHSLGQFNVVPALDFEQDQNLQTPYAYRNRGVDQPHITVDSEFNPFKDTRSPATNTVLRGGIPSKKGAEAWEGLYVGSDLDTHPEKEGFNGLQLESETITGSVFEAQSEEIDMRKTTFQLRRKYIVTTIKSGMVVIHQGRAHQRVLYERFLHNGTTGESVSQQLLFPLSLNFSNSDLEIVREMQGNLAAVGFVFGETTKDTLTITGVPLLVQDAEIGNILEQLIADYKMGVPGEGFSQIDVLSKTLAKATAVRTGDALNNDSQWALVNDLFACKESRLSPFNQPIYVMLTEQDIERKFA